MLASTFIPGSSGAGLFHDQPAQLYTFDEYVNGAWFDLSGSPDDEVDLPVFGPTNLPLTGEVIVFGGLAIVGALLWSWLR